MFIWVFCQSVYLYLGCPDAVTSKASRGCYVVPPMTPHLCCFLAGFVLSKLLPSTRNTIIEVQRWWAIGRKKRGGYISPALNGVWKMPKSSPWTSNSVSSVISDSWFPMDFCLWLESLMLNNIQMPITASAFGEVIMIHSPVKFLVTAMSSTRAFPPVKAYTGYVSSRKSATFLVGIGLQVQRSGWDGRNT